MSLLKLKKETDSSSFSLSIQPVGARRSIQSHVPRSRKPLVIGKGMEDICCWWSSVQTPCSWKDAMIAVPGRQLWCLSRAWKMGAVVTGPVYDLCISASPLPNWSFHLCSGAGAMSTTNLACTSSTSESMCINSTPGTCSSPKVLESIGFLK